MPETQTVWRSRADWYQSAYAPSIAEVRFRSDAGLQLIRVRQPAGYFAGPATSDLSLALLTHGDGVARADFGAGRFRGSVRSGQFALAPCGVACDYSIDSPHEFLMLTLPSPFVQASLSELVDRPLTDHGPLHAGMQHDTQIESVVHRLWTEASEGNPMGRLFAEDAAVALAGRLAKLALRASGGRQTLNDNAPPLHGVRLARVMARIEDELDADLRQAELAETAGISTWHFCRAFRAATGVAPHRFVLLRRLARAQLLLRGTKLRLTEVALLCGFSSHAHLSAVFRREIGTTPNGWRRELS